MVDLQSWRCLRELRRCRLEYVWVGCEVLADELASGGQVDRHLGARVQSEAIAVQVALAVVGREVLPGACKCTVRACRRVDRKQGHPAQLIGGAKPQPVAREGHIPDRHRLILHVVLEPCGRCILMRHDPTAKKHFAMAQGWQTDFNVMQSKANDAVYRNQREFFDRPVNYVTGMNTNKTNQFKPMEDYNKNKHERTIQQSINLIRALKNEQKDQLSKTRPKSVVAGFVGPSDNYGQIPNLRESVGESAVFLPVKRELGKAERGRRVRPDERRSAAEIAPHQDTQEPAALEH